MSDNKWRESVKIKIVRLKQSKQNILDLDSRLQWIDQISQFDRNTFAECIKLLDAEIDVLNFELLLDEMLESDLPLPEFLDKYGKDNLDT